MNHLLRINDAKSSAREKDANGYLIIRNNPIAKAGVFDYLESEVKKDGAQDKVVKVLRSFEVLEAKKDAFAKMPIVFGHQWVGEQTDLVAGAIGGEVTAKYPYLYADLIIYSQELIKAIEEDAIVELSPAYDLILVNQGGIYNGESYEMQQDLLNVNHLAVVREGRSGSDLRVLDNKNKGVKDMELLELLTKAIKRVKDESPEIEKEVTKAKDEDKRELIREIIAIASKPDGDFAGGESEKMDAITKLLEKVAYNPSEADKAKDEEKEVVVEKKEQEVEPVKKEGGGTEMSEKLENVAEVLAGIEKLMDAKIEALKTSQARAQDEKAVAYSEVSKVVGAFNIEGMDAGAIYAKGYEYLTQQKLADGLDAKSAFLVKSQDMRTSFRTQDSVSTEEKKAGLTDAEKALLANIK